MLSVNQILQEGRYRIVGQNGPEDTGLTTYQAFDNVLNTNVVIKETVFDATNQPLISKQLEGLVSIKHESFLKVHTYFSEVNQQYLVTESVEGENLKALLDRKKGPFLLFDVLSWTEQLLDALTYLHSKNPPVIHGNLAPHHLTLLKDNKIKLLSSTLNLSKKGSQNSPLSNLSMPYSSLESFWDTLDPVSQKVILNSYDERSAETLETPIDERSDIYALGATIYYLVTGVVPINALERSIDLLERKEDPLTNPSKINPQIPRNFSYFLLKSLELKRENRFESAAEMRSALQPMLELMKKVERETLKALEDPKVREAALREVELAREALRKQKEVNLPQTTQEPVIQTLPETPEPVEVAQPLQAPISQVTSFEEIETVKENPLPERTEPLPKVQVEPNKVERIEAQPVPVQPQEVEVESVSAQTQNFEAEKIEPEAEKIEPKAPERSVLVASAPIESIPAPIESVPAPIKPVAKPVEPVTKPVEPVETLIADEPDLFASAQTKSGKSWLIPVICVVVVLAIGGFFGFQYLNSQKGQSETKSETNQEAVKPNVSPNTESNVTENASPANSETPSSVNQATQTPTPVPEVEAQKTESNPAALTDDKGKTKKATTPVPAAAKTPAPATKAPTPKKLTVDDIIN